ncbi:hypothetical protein K1T71_012924 [Dendrolimus kikuchii]|uniref:Uncharacterized protein n=1 Tax=Dendrolimus kikuchii TaxID=765133 RepID=A0ACC1CIH0_9NEOP|nr:hypothetical protein K1T71_012924 [Dendrolimus kikuchii]
MDSLEKKRKGQWTKNQLRVATDAVKNKTMSQRMSADHFSIPRRTLRSDKKLRAEEGEDIDNENVSGEE